VSPYNPQQGIAGLEINENDCRVIVTAIASEGAFDETPHMGPDVFDAGGFDANQFAWENDPSGGLLPITAVPDSNFSGWVWGMSPASQVFMRAPRRRLSRTAARRADDRCRP
jgi:hypothetical protein